MASIFKAKTNNGHNERLRAHPSPPHPAESGKLSNTEGSTSCAPRGHLMPKDIVTVENTSHKSIQESSKTEHPKAIKRRKEQEQGQQNDDQDPKALEATTSYPVTQWDTPTSFLFPHNTFDVRQSKN